MKGKTFSLMVHPVRQLTCGLLSASKKARVE